MQLLSQDPDRLVFHVDPREVEILRQLVEVGLTARRGAICLSQDPEVLPAGALEDFAAAMEKSQATGRAFLKQVFQPDGGYLQEPAAGARGCGLTLTRTDLEQLLQALNELKLAHWERLGCPGDEADSEEESTAALPSMMVIDLVNQVQMLLLRALANED